MNPTEEWVKDDGNLDALWNSVESHATNSRRSGDSPEVPTSLLEFVPNDPTSKDIHSGRSPARDPDGTPGAFGSVGDDFSFLEDPTVPLGAPAPRSGAGDPYLNSFLGVSNVLVTNAERSRRRGHITGRSESSLSNGSAKRPRSQKSEKPTWNTSGNPVEIIDDIINQVSTNGDKFGRNKAKNFNVSRENPLSLGDANSEFFNRLAHELQLDVNTGVFSRKDASNHKLFIRRLIELLHPGFHAMYSGNEVFTKLFKIGEYNRAGDPAIAIRAMTKEQAAMLIKKEWVQGLFISVYMSIKKTSRR
jgi:hypothetical protein